MGPSCSKERRSYFTPSFQSTEFFILHAMSPPLQTMNKLSNWTLIQFLAYQDIKTKNDMQQSQRNPAISLSDWHGCILVQLHSLYSVLYRLFWVLLPLEMSLLFARSVPDTRLVWCNDFLSNGSQLKPRWILIIFFLRLTGSKKNRHTLK